MSRYPPTFQPTGLEIAVIGMACRFPGADNPARFWQNLRAGASGISFFSEQELLAAGVAPHLLADPQYVRAGAVIEGIELFDAAFFDLAPREVEVMEPQHRIFLECAWEALERAGYDPHTCRAAIGVYAGANMNTYFLQLHPHIDPTESMENLPILTGNDKDYLATRVSYKLNLNGPSLTVQTACSTSLVAVHLACRGLLSGECDMALAGGVSVRVPQKAGYRYHADGIYSPDGYCRAFDARGQGTVFGSGAGVVVLKRLDQALTDNDTILAVIKGSAINNDGSAKVGFTAPSVDGQARVIRLAQMVADVTPDTISYIEAHGTATSLGDPIEIQALNEAFAGTSARGFCALGSVKTNIGHLDTAAGVAGLIKTILALQHCEIPPSLHFEQPNPHIDFAGSPFFVNTALRRWPEGAAPARAGVSSFGVGGTNAHVILEAAPVPLPAPAVARPWQLLVLSARSASALDTMTANLASHLEQHPDLALADVAHTLQAGRRAFAHRRALVCQTIDEACEALRTPGTPHLLSARHDDTTPVPAWLFPGQGTQYAGMAHDLYASEPRFRETVDRCAELLRPHLGRDLREVLYPDPARMEDGGWKIEEHETAILHPPSSILNQTQYAQPALFVVEYALAQLLLSWGVRPQAMIGHSIGEYVAATLSGVFALEHALQLVAARGRLVQSLPAGAMLAVPLGADALRPLLEGQVTLAAINGPAACVVAGSEAAVARLEAHLAEREVTGRRLRTSHAFHSPMLDPILRPFLDLVQRIPLRPPQIPFVSNLTGTWISAAEATNPNYWVRHLRQPVRFADGLAALLEEPRRLLLEVGPGRALTRLASEHPAFAAGHATVATLPGAIDQRSDNLALQRAIGQLWLAGVPIDWQAMNAHQECLRVPLPTYPFERQRYWVAPLAAGGAPAPALLATSAPAPDYQLAIPAWRRSLPPLPWDAAMPEGRWLVFSTPTPLADALVARVRQAGPQVTVVLAGSAYGQDGEVYTIDPHRPEDYAALFADLARGSRLPDRALHLWPAACAAPDDHRQALEQGYLSLLRIAQAIGEQPRGAPLPITVVTTGAQYVAGEPSGCSDRAMVPAAALVIPQEYPGLRCRAVDVVPPEPARAAPATLVDQIIAECLEPDDTPVVAYRGRDRWVPAFEPIPAELPRRRSPLRDRGVYLITGGLGGVGLWLARYLARHVSARLALLSRTALPPRADWEPWLRAHAAADRASATIRHLLALEALGAEVLLISADCAEPDQMREARGLIRARYGRLDGIVHAAGVAGGRIIQHTGAEDSWEVLRAKVQGARVLEQVFGEDELELLLLCSSTIALVGGIGQADYCAANRFLDAFAHAAIDRPWRTLSINWDGWRGVGMNAAPDQRGRGVQLAHPLLQRLVRATPDERLYAGRLDGTRHWVLAEHTVAGVPTLPGAAYVELMHAALAEVEPPGTITLRDLFFMSPLMVPGQERPAVYVQLTPRDGGYAIRIMGALAEAGAGPRWIEYARATGERQAQHAPLQHDLAALSARCPQVVDLADFDQQDPDGLVRWGPRWRNLRDIRLGTGEALASLELPPPFAADLADLVIHPALLDVATSFMALAIGLDRYVPLSYRRVCITGALPARCYCHARRRPAASSDQVHFDITIMDAAGYELIVVEDFVLIHEAAIGAVAERPEAGGALGAASHAEPPRDVAGAGLLPEAALAALDQILGGVWLPQIVVTAGPIDTIGQQPSIHVSQPGEHAALPPAPTGYARPALRTDYVAPGTPAEQDVAAVWRRVLGVDQIGINDNFFDLGGHSLLAAQIVDQLRQTFRVELPLSRLIEDPTVAAVARTITDIQEAEQAREMAELLSMLDQLSEAEVEAELRKRTRM